MKKQLLALSVIAAASFATASLAQAANTITFTGSVSANTCTIGNTGGAAAGADFTVVLPPT